MPSPWTDSDHESSSQALSSWERCRLWLVHKVGGHSLAGTFVVAGSALLGGVLALGVDRLRESLKRVVNQVIIEAADLVSWDADTPIFFDVPDDAPSIWGGTLFCLLFLSVAFVAWLKELARASEARALRNELNDQIDGLRKITLTMPPRNYLERYGEESHKVIIRAQTTLVGVTEAIRLDSTAAEKWRDHLNQTIRLVLDSILNLAINFDSPHESHTPIYWASIFWMRAPSELNEADSEVAWQSASQLSRHDDHASFMGNTVYLLIRDTNLTTSRLTLDQSDEEPRPISPLVLGWEEVEHPEMLNMPGLTLAIDTSRYSRAPDSGLLTPKLQEFGYSARERVKTFFDTRDEFRSMMSMVLSGVNPLDAEEADIAVLTLHRNEPGIMRTSERADMFFHQLMPLLPMLFQLCWARMTLDANAGNHISVYTNHCKAPDGEDAVNDNCT